MLGASRHVPDLPGVPGPLRLVAGEVRAGDRGGVMTTSAGTLEGASPS